MRHTSVILGLAGFAISCGDTTEPQVEAIPLVVGAYCAPETATAESRPPWWLVTITRNVSTPRDTARADGVVVRQAVRSCETKVCVEYQSMFTADGAIAECRRQNPSA